MGGTKFWGSQEPYYADELLPFLKSEDNFTDKDYIK